MILLSNNTNYEEAVSILKKIDLKKKRLKNHKTNQEYAKNLVIPAIKNHLLSLVEKEAESNQSLQHHKIK